MNVITLILFIVGLGLLVLGAEMLVRGSSRLAARVGISPLVIGLTVVAYGTSAPEMAVSIQSAFAGQADIALGNVVGSNIFNVLFILGICAALAPLVVQQQLVRLDVPLMIGVSVLMLILALDGSISRLDGLLLFILMISYTVFAIWQSRRETQAVEAEYEQEFGEAKLHGKTANLPVQVALIGVGLVLLVVGSRWLVNGAIAIATTLGVSELIIGLTIIAAGTSLPEVAASIIATLRGERDIAIGNVVGSNIFNILSVLGLSSLVSPDGINVPLAALAFDIPVAIAVAVACLPIFFTGYRIARWEGLVFLGYYVAYTLYLILGATEHDALPVFSSIMLLFVLPLTALTMAVVTWRAYQRSRQVATEGV